MLSGNREIARFVQHDIRPHLAKDFTTYKKRDLVRMYGSYVQHLAFSFSRNGTLRAHPTFFVVGADLSLPVIPQNTSLEVIDPWRWSFAGAVLDQDFAQRFVRQLENLSPLSFTAPLADAATVAIPRVFGVFVKHSEHWSHSLYLAYYLLATGHKDAPAAAKRARAQFDRLGRIVIGLPPPWRVALGQRILELDRRLSFAEGPSLCREDAEEQAVKLGLPKITWQHDV